MLALIGVPPVGSSNTGILPVGLESNTGILPVGLESGMADSPMSSSGSSCMADSPMLSENKHGRVTRATHPAHPAHPTYPANPTLRAIQLYQQLLRFHLNDAPPRLALADADLARINWAASLFGPITRDRHLAALRAFIERHARDAPAVATAASLELARFLEAVSDTSNSDYFASFRNHSFPMAAHFDPAAAVTVAEAALANDPDSINKNARDALRELITRAKAPSLEYIATETTWPTDPAATAPVITIGYRNLTKIHFRAFPIDWKKPLSQFESLSAVELIQKFDPAQKFQNSEDTRAQIELLRQFDLARKNDYAQASNTLGNLINQPPAKSWSVTIPATPDYRYREEKISAPRDLAPGHYLIAASLDENFSNAENNVIIHAKVWVSNLAIIHDGVDETGRLTGFVLNATTGAPVPGASVTAYTNTIHDITYAKSSATTTNQDGSFALAPQSGPNRNAGKVHVHVADTTGQAIVMTDVSSEIAPRKSRASNPSNYVYIFTDRSVYRPGQTIQFKAVVIQADSNRTEPKLLSNHRFTIVLDNHNWFYDRKDKVEEIGRLELTTNDFGSAAGSFIVPAGTPGGDYRLRIIKPDYGYTQVCIAEYEQPKLAVTLHPPATTPKPNDTVTIIGTATACTGKPVNGANVTWRVRRALHQHTAFWEVLKPTIVAQGSTTTDATGNFAIAFDGFTDSAVGAKDVPLHTFFITADVTDSAGKTCTDTRVIAIGGAALSASITTDGTWFASQWHTPQDPVILKLATTAPDGKPQAATGVVAIHPLKQPPKVPRSELHAAPRSDFFTTLRPNRLLMASRPPPGINSLDTRDWPIEEEPVATLPFTTNATTGRAELTQKLPAGIYRAIVTTNDQFGAPATAQTDIRVLAPDAKTHPIKEPLSLAAPTWTAQPGGTINALWSTGCDTARARIVITQDGKVLRSFWTDPGVTQQRIPITITESMRGGITLQVFQVSDNRLFMKTQDIHIPWGKLEITWERFNSKLTPGGRETWTARITTSSGADRQPAAGSSDTGGSPAVLGGTRSPPASAELVATLFDESLDQHLPHFWPILTAPFREETKTYYKGGSGHYGWNFNNYSTVLSAVDNPSPASQETNPAPQYRHWNDADSYAEWFGYHSHKVTQTSGYAGNSSTFSGSLDFPKTPRPRPRRVAPGSRFQIEPWNRGDTLTLTYPEITGDDDETILPSFVVGNTHPNPGETAFFFPQLRTDSDGAVRMEFTVPEAFARWVFLGFAHDKQVRYGVLADSAVTARRLAVQPNPPSELREGGAAEFTVTVTNRTDKPQQGVVRLSFADAATLAPVGLFADSAGVENPKSQGQDTQGFSLPPNSSQTLSWRITIPGNQGLLIYKAIASTADFSDGEEGFLPLPVRAP